MKKIILSIIGILALLGAYSALNNESKAKPTTARIDIYEKTTNTIPCFKVKEIPSGKNFPFVDWMEKLGQQGYVIQKDSVSQELEIMINSDKCKINFALRGPWELKYNQDGKKASRNVGWNIPNLQSMDRILSPSQPQHGIINLFIIL